MKQYQAKQLITISCCIDDMSPELYPQMLEKLLVLGAKDTWLVPIIMKKGRPGIKLEVLCDLELKDQVVTLIFQETSSIGVRVANVERMELERKELIIEVEGIKIRVKVAYSTEGERLNAKPEFEDCLLLADKMNLALKEVMTIVQAKIAETIS